MRTDYFFLFLFGLTVQIISGQSATIKGKVLDSINNPIENATISIGNLGTVSDENGAYLLRVPAGKNVEIRFGHVAYNSFSKSGIDDRDDSPCCHAD